MNQPNQLWRFTQRLSAVVLTGLLTLPPAMAQQPAPAQPAKEAAGPTAAAATIRSLRVIALAGENGENDLQARVMSPLAVQVLDLNDRPVEGVPVIFRFPLTGPSARFADGQPTVTMMTDAGGQARATGWNANEQEGPFSVFVTASRGSEQGTLSIPMINVPRVIPVSELKRNKKPWWKTKWAKIGYIAGAAAIATAIILTNTGSSSTTIKGTPGTPTIGGPQ